MTGTGDRPLVHTRQQSLGMRYRLLLALAWGVVFWERLWISIWKPVLVVAVFIATVLLDFLPALPGWLHLAVLAGFFVVFIVLSFRALRRFKMVDMAAARRRLERDSGLSHRPLSSLADRPVSGADTLSLKIWLAHVGVLAGVAKTLSLRPPSPGLAARDPFAVRAAVLLALVIGLVAGYDQAGPRLARALSIGGGTTDRFSVEIWLTPPTYSGRPPIFLSNEGLTNGRKNPDLVNIPTGSVLSAHLAGHSVWYAPSPVLEIGERDIPFTSIAATGKDEKQSFRLETVIAGADKMQIRVRANGATVASWMLTAVSDLPPTAMFTDPPKPISRSRLQFAYRVTDDYAVNDLTLEMRLQDRTLLTGARIKRLNLPVLGAPARRRHIERQSVHDLTAHPWAGLPVALRLLVRDGAGQEGTSGWAKIVLPERTFNNDVARAIIAQRRRLALLRPESRRKIERDIVVGLGLIKDKPEAYNADVVVFLSLGVAQARLVHSQAASRYDSVMELLWNTAIRLEDGGLAVAERDLQQARDALRNALQEGASAAKIEQLMDRTQRALTNYLTALAERMDGKDGTQGTLDPMLRMLGADDLQGLLEKARQLARTGATDAARQMLSQLDRLLESVHGATQGGSATAALNEKLKQVGEILSRLRRLEDQQQDLLDKTFGAISSEARQTPTQSAAAINTQKALRQELGQLMLDADDVLGSIPAPLGPADRNMTGAETAFGQGQLPEYQRLQAAAVDNLHQAAEEISAAMAKMIAGGFGLSLGGDSGGLVPGGRDPFGRMTGQGGLMPGGAIGIPERGEIQRSRKILDELRRRAGQRQRPKPERDYIDRLLRKF